MKKIRKIRILDLCLKHLSYVYAEASCNCSVNVLINQSHSRTVTVTTHQHIWWDVRESCIDDFHQSDETWVAVWTGNLTQSLLLHVRRCVAINKQQNCSQ